jgi:hypothetical protein
MNSSPQRFQCEPHNGLNYPAGIRPPELYAYPTVAPTVRLLFIGWNPPRPFGGFWSLDSTDNLRTELHRILLTLNQIKAREPGDNFLKEFLNTGYFFIHAVKCWTAAKYPGFGREAKRADRRLIGEPLLHACVETHLREELRQLAPEKVCALGELAYCALRHLFPRLDEDATPTEGRIFEPSRYQLDWRLLYTCFPSTTQVRGEPLREITRRHLKVFACH